MPEQSAESVSISVSPCVHIERRVDAHCRQVLDWELEEMSRPGKSCYLTCAARFCAALLLVLNSLFPYPFRPSPPLSPPPSLSALVLITPDPPVVGSLFPWSLGDVGLEFSCIVLAWSRGEGGRLLCERSCSRRTIRGLAYGHAKIS
jgi:hypothetical protein